MDEAAEVVIPEADDEGGLVPGEEEGAPRLRYKKTLFLVPLEPPNKSMISLPLGTPRWTVAMACPFE